MMTRKSYFPCFLCNAVRTVCASWTAFFTGKDSASLLVRYRVVSRRPGVFQNDGNFCRLNSRSHFRFPKVQVAFPRMRAIFSQLGISVLFIFRTYEHVSCAHLPLLKIRDGSPGDSMKPSANGGGWQRKKELLSFSLVVLTARTIQQTSKTVVLYRYYIRYHTPQR